MVAKAKTGKASAQKSAEKKGRGRPAGAGIAKDKDAAPKKVVKYAFTKEDNLQIYIYRLLKQVHPEMGIGR